MLTTKSSINIFSRENSNIQNNSADNVNKAANNISVFCSEDDNDMFIKIINKKHAQL